MDRLPAELIAAARERPASVIAEMGIATEWRVPLPSLGSAEPLSTIVTALSTPPLVRDSAAALASRLAGSSAREVDSGQAAPHVGAPHDIAALALELSP